MINPIKKKTDGKKMKRTENKEKLINNKELMQDKNSVGRKNGKLQIYFQNATTRRWSSRKNIAGTKIHTRKISVRIPDDHRYGAV